jgi:nucleotide-binding universal stress UspA family protein
VAAKTSVESAESSLLNDERSFVSIMIVLAVDGSKHGRWAMQWVPRLPLATPPTVNAVHVIDVGALRGPFLPQPIVLGNEPNLRAEIVRLEQKATRVVAETKEFLSSMQLDGKVVVENGRPGPAVLKYARRGDIIVLGSRGATGVERFLLGSVSQSVMLHAPSSVLVVKQPPRVIRRILLATDGSKSSGKAIRFLIEQLQPRKIEINLVHVLPFRGYPELKSAGQALLDRDAGRLAKVGYTVNEVLKLGQPAEEIIKIADRQKVDLIVVGAKGLGAIARFLLGSVSTKVVQHSNCSVLVVR